MTTRDDYHRLVADRPEFQLGDSHIGHSLAMDAYADRLEAALAAAVEREEQLRAWVGSASGHMLGHEDGFGDTCERCAQLCAECVVAEGGGR